MAKMHTKTQQNVKNDIQTINGGFTVKNVPMINYTGTKPNGSEIIFNCSKNLEDKFDEIVKEMELKNLVKSNIEYSFDYPAKKLMAYE